MIRLKRSGTYRLIETKNNTKILYLDNDTYAWVEPPKIGEILVVSHTLHRSDDTLSMGHYVLYSVKDEPYLTDLYHLELEYGRKSWQGYLLPTGLPDTHKHKAKIIPCTQIITGNPRYEDRSLTTSLAATIDTHIGKTTKKIDTR